MSTKHLLRSFAGGEITPELAGRLDLVKYQTGLSLARNFITLPHGPAVRRPGLEFINEAKDSTRKVRILPFSFSASQTAVLEFGHQYLRVHIDGGTLLEATKAISSISGSTVNTSSAHGYSTGDWVYIGTRYYKVTVVDSDTFTTTDLEGNAATASGATAARVFTLATPYDEADLFDLHYAQSADIVTITHPNYATRDLARQSATSWTLTSVSFAPPNAAPTNVSATPTVAQNQNLTQAKYVVTAVMDDGVTESLPSSPASATNNLALAGNYNTIIWTGVDGYSRYNVYKLRGGVYGYIGQVTPSGASPKSISSAVAYQSDGLFKFRRVRVVTTVAHGYSTGDRVVIDGTTFYDGLFQVTVENSTTFTYARNTAFAFTVNTGTASTPSLLLVDDNVQADTTQSPPEDIIGLNAGTNDYPAATVYHEQRRWFAGTNAKPQVLWATRTGTDTNMTSSLPSREADAMELRVASSQYNPIRHLVALSDLIALTAGGEFRIYADGAPAITPTSVSIKPQGYAGASNVQPVVTTGSILYVQAQGSRIRELAYSWEANAYRTTDASIMAPHRFNGYTITDLAYSRAPESMLWAVRNDGKLLGMTYVPDQQVYGWHAHDTDGMFESVTVVPEGNEDVMYAVVKREVNDRTVRYVERMRTRVFVDQADAFFVDAGLTYTAREGTFTMSGAPTVPVVTDVDHGLTTGATVNLQFFEADGTPLPQFDAAYTATVVTSKIFTIPLSVADVITGRVKLAVSTVSGLWHLEGKEVDILADGAVAPRQTVTNGQVTLQGAASTVSVGLPITADLRTLPLAIEGAQAAGQGTTKNVNKVHMRVSQSSIVKAGPSFDRLREYPARAVTDPYGSPPALRDGELSLSVDPSWNTDAAICVRQDLPLPLNVLSMTLEVQSGG